ncbi:MAG: glycoside hydrolase family 65 protein [Frankiaceae bacterium]
MIGHPAFGVEPWCLRETGLHLDVLAQSESVLALANGHVGVRGNLDEGDPHAIPGSYLGGVFELRPLRYGEAGYGYPESSQSLINVTNGKLIRLLVDDEPFDVRYGELRSHERVLDFRAGTLSRRAEWTSPAGSTVRLVSTRLVSLTQRAILAVHYEVEPVDGPVHVAVQSELVANEPLPTVKGDDPRVGLLQAPLRGELHAGHGLAAELVHATGRSGLHVAAAMDHVVECPASYLADLQTEPDLARMTVAVRLEPGQRLRIVKLVAHGWSKQRSVPALRDQVAAALTTARQTGWDGLLADQRSYLDGFWERADVEVDGDPEIQQAVRFALFHLVQAGARTERRAIPAKGLTGPGYDGHSFWDTEAFVLRVLTYTAPRAVADALRWRHSTLPVAVARARQLGLDGATFPWRTIDGAECSGYWPAGTAAFHVGAGIADAVIRYVAVTGDEAFEEAVGLELLVETARMWRSLGHFDVDHRFRIDGVTGPDEYSAIADDNVYTNLMAQRNMRGAVDAARRHPSAATRLGVSDDDLAAWTAAADAVHVPYDERLGVHQQSDGYTHHEKWDFAATAPEQYPLLLHFPYFDLYRKQVVKQADLVLAMELRGDAFTPEEKARNFAYYEALTVRDSSLSSCTQAVIAAEVGHVELAYAYLCEAALVDLDDVQHNTRNGLHLAALAGAWIALVGGFGGLRDHEGVPALAPRLPGSIQRLAFRLAVRGTRLRVEVTPCTTTYEVLDGVDVALLHDGERLVLSPGRPVTRPTIAIEPVGPPPAQPPGRRPVIRRPSGQLRPS